MLKIFNSLSKQKEEFTPIEAGRVGLYSCGPTVYDFAHIGNLRSYIFADVLRRTLSANGLQVKFVMNITDVDDKTINRSQAEHISLSQLTSRYTMLFLDDLAALNIQKPDMLPHATEEIDGMVELIKTMLANGTAYKTANGDIYYDISKNPNYGKLANVDLAGLKDNAEGRLSKEDEYEKENVRDFALWKAYDPSDGEVFWETEIGKGRPGWHIECSAMSTKYLGQPFDIHVGGIDLLFPHHTNEIAQSESASNGTALANYWMHAEHLLVDNAKMSKSKNNFYTTKDLSEKGVDLMAFRYLILSTHYRSKLNFTWESLKASQNALFNLYENVSAYPEASAPDEEYLKRFMEAVNDDLNTAEGLAVMWDLIKSDKDGSVKLATLLEMDTVLGLKIKENWDAAQAVPQDVRDLLAERVAARDQKDFAKSDSLRQAIEDKGYLLEDTPTGARLKKKY